MSTDKTPSSRSRHSQRGSVSLALAQLRQGDSQAAQKLNELFWKRVLGLARQKLKQKAIPPKQAGASDVAQDALLSFFRALKNGRYEFLNDRDGLWALLARITENKVKDLQRHRQRRAARGMIVGGDSALPADAHGQPLGLSELAADPHRSPADEDEYAEACLAASQSVLLRLNERQQHIVLGKAGGRTNAQLAKELKCTERTVELNLAAIRREARKSAE